MNLLEPFWNREKELSRIRGMLGTGRFGYVTGRRRVGKTATLRKACEDFGGFYHQAVEGTPEQQLLHLTEEIRESLPLFRDVTPKTWTEFLRLLSREKLSRLIVFDEFPYWVQGDPTLPSILQKWIDHDLEKLKTFVLVSGSSQSMLNSQFLERGSPLYGRAALHVNLEPMSYAWFCRALNYEPGDPLSFTRFSLVGGVPHYWKLMPKGSLIQQAEELYFQPAALLAEEPIYWMRDEGITGTLPKAILDLVGRGVTKPSELAGRLNTAQGNLSRPLALLLDLGFIQRELPFGKNPRNTKRVFYNIQDPSLAFYYGTFLLFRTRWAHLETKEKERILDQHASRQWENFCRNLYPDSARYWEGPIEIDFIALQPARKQHLIAECKWGKVSDREEKSLLAGLKSRFSQTQLSRKLKNVEFRIFAKNHLEKMASGVHA